VTHYKTIVASAADWDLWGGRCCSTGRAEERRTPAARTTGASGLSAAGFAFGIAAGATGVAGGGCQGHGGTPIVGSFQVCGKAGKGEFK